MALRRTLLAAALLLLLAAAAGAGWWLLLARQTAAGIEDWIAERRDEGYAVAHGDVAVSGFPTEIAVRIAQPAIRRPGPAAALSWRGPALAFAAPVWRPDDIRFSLPGTQRIAAAAPPAGMEVRIEAADIAGTLRPDGAGWALRAEGRDFALAGDGPALRAPVVRVRAQSAPLRLGIEIERLQLPEPGPFGPAIDRIELTAAPTALPADLTPEALAAWRAAGGRIAIDRLALVWGPLGIEAEGALTLDPRMRPAGALTARIRGYEAAIDALVGAGRLPAENAPALKLVGRLLAARAPDGTIELPLRLEDGWLSIGPIRVAPLPPLFPAPG